ncbi:hypothetical protein MPH_01141 [Macrophomina phaseolina MS6]|uniref:Uncharacterized protein n=2 Tax=Macrophomina phaseolina TaxID=35725 RepID=K2S9K4_MACPH|nr:hypothetical protein MPH_01141 [Macrophomina phaseolina MS6]
MSSRDRPEQRTDLSPPPSSFSSGYSQALSTYSPANGGDGASRRERQRRNKLNTLAWVVARNWRRAESSSSEDDSNSPPDALSYPLTEARPGMSSEAADLANKFSLLARLSTSTPKSGQPTVPTMFTTPLAISAFASTTAAPSHIYTSTTTSPVLSKLASAAINHSPPSPSPSPAPAPAPTEPVVSKRLGTHSLTASRIIFVKNPHGETSWRGHPGIIMAVDGCKAHVVTLTTWKDKNCVQKWAGATRPARYREWFLLVDDGRTRTHDTLPVMMLQGGKQMPKLCYVDCKRSHWLERNELEKFRYHGDTEYFVTQESLAQLESHLAYLETVETPWIDDVVAGSESGGPGELEAVSRQL